MDPLTLVVLALFVAMVVVWVVLPSNQSM